MAVGFISTWAIVGDMPEQQIVFERPDNAWLASERGYPKVMDRAMYFLYLEGDETIAYTTATEIAEGVFLVGNTWVSSSHRGKGLHAEILKWRNGELKETFGGTHIYTCLNPKPDEGILTSQLEKTVASLGYKKVGAMGMKYVRLRDRVHVLCSGLPVWGKEL
jgi:predicted GNAT family acetyltransferase